VSRVRLAALLIFSAAAPLAGQLPRLPGAGEPALRLNGELGTFGELYSRSGAPGRRPGQTGRLWLNADATLFGSVTMGVTLLATTEDGATLGAGSSLPGRQNISQLGLHPRWSWGSAHIGTFSDNYTTYTYNAVQISGAAVDLRPGRLHAGAFGGRAANAVSGGAVNGAYHRSAVGGRLGYGTRTSGAPSTFVELTMVRVWDDPNSLALPDTTLPPNAPTTGGSLVNPYAVTPAENVVVSTSGGVSLFRGMVAWRGELAGAVHTRDVRASELDSTVADVPGVLRGLVTPRVGTHGDYALSSDLQLRRVTLPGARPGSPRTLTAGLSFRHVGPGYTSLGAASLANDVQALDVRANVRFARWSAQLQAGHQNDNLVGQKLNTTNRYRLGGTFLMRMSRVWNASFRGSLNTMANGSADSLQWMDYHAMNIGTGQSFAFGPRRRVESLTFDYSYQDAGDGNPLRSASSFSAHSLTSRLAIRVAPTVQVIPEAGFTRSQSDTLAAVTRATAGVNAAWRLWAGRLGSSVYLGRTRYASSGNWMVVVSSRLRVTPHDEVVLGIQLNRFADTAVPNRDFNEQTLNLRWVRRF